MHYSHASRNQPLPLHCLLHRKARLHAGLEERGYCSVSRDKHPIMLRQTTSQPAGWVWIGVESTAIFEQLKSSGATVLQQPRNYSWAYEMKFADPDGNVLWLGTESRSDIPFQD